MLKGGCPDKRETQQLALKGNRLITSGNRHSQPALTDPELPSSRLSSLSIFTPHEHEGNWKPLKKTHEEQIKKYNAKKMQTCAIFTLHCACLCTCLCMGVYAVHVVGHVSSIKAKRVCARETNECYHQIRFNFQIAKMFFAATRKTQKMTPKDVKSYNKEITWRKWSHVRLQWSRTLGKTKVHTLPF